MSTEERQVREEVNKELRFKRVNQQQMISRAAEVEKLIEVEHPARAIWGLVGQLDLSAFRAEIKEAEGEAGRSAHDPQLLIGSELRARRWSDRSRRWKR